MVQMASRFFVLTVLLWTMGANASDSFSLLQTKVEVVDSDNQLISLDDGATSGTPPDCSPAQRMDIGLSTVEYSNLGGMGPDTDGPEGILYKNVLAGTGKNIDLLVRALSTYTPLKQSGNGKVANFGRINIATGTSVTCEFEFQDGDTNQPVLMDPFTMSFVDLDEQAEDGYGREFISIADEHEYILTSTSVVGVDTVDGATVFHSTEHGTGKDNPKNAMGLTQSQRDKSVQLVFPAISIFTVTLSAGAAPAHWSANSRNLLFAGQTNVYCPPDEPLPENALCETMNCPKGWKLQKKKKLEGLFCESDECTLEDLKTCCQVDLCSTARALTLSGDSMTRNNLGSQGPDSGEEGMYFENVFPQSDNNINMLVSADLNYKRKSDRLNGVRNKIGRVNLVTGGSTTLSFKFFDADNANAPAKVGPFYMSFLDFDEQQSTGKAREYVTIHNFNRYVVSDSTVVIATQADALGEAMTFSSSTFGTGEDNAEQVKSLTQDQKDKSVSVVVPKGQTFSVDFKVAALPGGSGNSRYIQFAGATNLVCDYD